MKGEISLSTVKIICLENEDDVIKSNDNEGMPLEKEADPHEDSDDESHYGYDDDNFIDNFWFVAIRNW